MTIQITESQGVFHIKGSLNSENADALSRYLTKEIATKKNIILNLEKVVEFDKNAAFALMKLYIKSIYANGMFTIIGMKNKKLLRVLQETETIHIWSHSNNLT